MAWHIITTEPRREFAVAAGLVGWGVPTYLPTHQVRVRAAPITRKPFRMEDRPLFPGYVFAQLGSGRGWKAVHAISGLSGYLRGADGPRTISDAAVAAVRRVEGELLESAQKAAKVWNPGDRVEIDGDEWSVWKDCVFSIQAIDKSSRATLLLMAEQSWPVRVTAPIARLKEPA